MRRSRRPARAGRSRRPEPQSGWALSNPLDAHFTTRVGQGVFQTKRLCRLNFAAQAHRMISFGQGLPRVKSSGGATMNLNAAFEYLRKNHRCYVDELTQ